MPSCNGTDRCYASPGNGADLFLAVDGWKGGKAVKAYAPNASNDEDDADIIALVKGWETIEWNEATNHVNRLQARISKAELLGKHDLVKRLSYLLTHSFYAKALAVKKVTSNRGKCTAGVDGDVWLTPKCKMRAVNGLTDRGYRAKPLRRVYIPKSNGKKRPLSIPTMYDRAMQALYAMALDPVAEARADPNSYGFRIGRCCQDAAEQIFKSMNSQTLKEWVVETDIRACFDSFCHDWIIKHIPMDKSVLRQFLKAGFIFRNKMYPTDEGVPQGGVVSPIIANMVLDGLEPILDERFGKGNVRLVRYADDSVCMCKTRETAVEVMDVIQDFMFERGLELSEEKTLVTHINDGFDFLGFDFRRTKGKLIIQPSKKSIRKLMERMHECIFTFGKAWIQKELIGKLNSILRGWAQYHRHNCASVIFATIDHMLFKNLVRWAKRRHSNKGFGWVASKYWKTVNGRKWIFTDDGHALILLSDVHIVRHMKIKAVFNPYLDSEYLLKRKAISKAKNQLILSRSKPPLQRGCQRLKPCAGKLARTV